MEINNLNRTNIIEQNIGQEKFLETTMGKLINNGVDIGIRAILPDFVENQVIELKDNLFNYGLKEGISKTITDTIELGKSAIGIVTGNFENINQIQKTIQKGGLLDSISGVLDTIVNKVNKQGLINNSVANTIREGKNIILNNVQGNIEKEFLKQENGLENLETHINRWKEGFERKDIETMNKEYKTIEKELKNLIPIEKTIREANTIKNIQNIIKNNGGNLDLTNEELKLAEKL